MKCSLATAICLLLFLSSVCSGQINLEQGLIGCYPFTGNAKDYSPSNNDGLVSGAKLVKDRFGNMEAAYEFDGYDDHIEISPKDLQLNNFTYSIWVNPNVLPNRGEGLFLFSVGSDYGDQHILFGDHYSNDRHTGLSHGSYLGVANNVVCTESSVEPTGKWYHLVLIKDNDYYYFYVDNRLACKNSVHGGKAFYGTTTVRAMIGARNNYRQAASAIIDDIHLYNRAINQNEVEALFKGPKIENNTVPSEILANKTTVCGGETITLRAKSNQPGSEFKWTVDGVAQNERSNELKLTIVDKGVDYMIDTQVEVSFDDLCFKRFKPSSASRPIQVKHCSEPGEEEEITRIFAPNAFTPNHDGKNDIWEIINADKFKDLQVWIFNRWGEVIFYSSGYAVPWDGTYKGKIVPSGVYTYKILLKKNLTKSGALTIVY
jgi:gliding motility-associated-like protein